ncbi:hypothetical protein JW766_03295 [Candidatus Dojkabacteria bacterium]|nr:hypothetical protein [Candidatus Dojkabacteria bacterium]
MNKIINKKSPNIIFSNKKQRGEQSQTAQIGTKVKIKYTSDFDKDPVVCLIVPQVDTTNDNPQIEATSDLGKAIIGAKPNSIAPIYYHDKHRGLTGVYLLDVLV